ncbi:MAG TPA: hypothetical protein VM735_00080 [Candidatus Kapabacteria bacterium]|nr:hypothetical protein [Candidatus Kapabacteria bacterium]
MRISFVLGPAGSGKTFRCLSEIRDELLSAPEGSPLIFVAPKQSTYQLERQLLEGELAGYSRLHIVSFERLARFVFQQLAVPVPRFLSEQGRTMVLRALLTEAESGLSIFKGAARRMGFPEEVSKQIREFQNHGLNPSDVRKIATQLRSGHSAREKLQDLAFLHEQYSAWLAEQEVEDGDALLSAATEALRKTTSSPFAIAGLWFDGFAQLTPQELELLVEVLRFSHRGTLAFCIDPSVNASSKISSGFLVRKTVERCRAAVEQRYGIWKAAGTRAKRRTRMWADESGRCVRTIRKARLHLRLGRFCGMCAREGVIVKWPCCCAICRMTTRTCCAVFFEITRSPTFWIIVKASPTIHWRNSRAAYFERSLLIGNAMTGSPR